MNKDCVYITVVRDEEMYSRLVKDNPCNRGGDFRLLDNRSENKSVTERYNAFLESWDYSKDAWFVFIHEDYEFLEPLSPILKRASKACIYGTVGMKSVRSGSDVLWALNSNRDGSRLGLYGNPIKKPVEVLTTDCNCMIVHSSLVKKHGLRFDENLLFDFYTEDFEMNAYERFGIKTYVLPAKNHHYSFGNIGKRFLTQRRYLLKKYANASRVYRTTTRQFFGPMREVVRTIYQNRLLRRLDRPKRLGHFFWYKKYSRDGYCRIRIFGLRFKWKVRYVA